MQRFVAGDRLDAYGGEEVRVADRFDLALKLLVGGKTNEPVPRSDADLLPVEYWVATMPHVELAAAEKRHELHKASSPEARGDDARLERACDERKAAREKGEAQAAAGCAGGARRGERRRAGRGSAGILGG